MDYASARNELRDGDVLLFRGREILSRIVQMLTGSEYSHCGIVATWGGRRMLLHADPTRDVSATPVSTFIRQYPGDADWFALAPGARAHLDLDALVGEARAHLGLEYALGDVVRAGAHVHLGAPPPALTLAPKALFCSAYLARVFRAVGHPLAPKADNLVSPADIASSPLLAYRGTIARASAMTLPSTLPPPKRPSGERPSVHVPIAPRMPALARAAANDD